VREQLRNERRRPIGFFLLLIAIGQLGACREPTAQDLVGTWQVDYGKSKLTLTLKPDFAFDELFKKTGDAKAVLRSGTWKLTEFEGPAVLLIGTLFVQDQTGDIDEKLSAGRDGGWVLHINKTFGHLNLTVDEDSGLYFEKTGP
jgi:hypothetical protein